MKLLAAIRRLSFWKRGQARANAEPTADVGGDDRVPGSSHKDWFRKLFRRVTETAALAKIGRSVGFLINRTRESIDSSFRAKVLLPVTGCMVVAMAVTFFIVDHRIAQQAEQEARNTLATANAVIRS